MDIAVTIFLLCLVVPAVLVTLYIRREIRNRLDFQRERLRQLEELQRKQAALIGNPKSVTREKNR